MAIFPGVHDERRTGAPGGRARHRLSRELSLANDAAWRALGHGRHWLRTATPGAKVIIAIVSALLIAPFGYHALTLLVPLPLVNGTESYCTRHSLGCDFATHLLGDVVFAVILYALFLRRQARTATTWRRRARHTPEMVFTWLGPVSRGLTEVAAEVSTDRRSALRGLRRGHGHASSPLVESILGRDELVREIADDLAHGGEAQVIVANSAAGKTMVLVKLADHLARHGFVPVAISLQNHRRLDFAQIAWKAFEYASPPGDEEDLKRQWGELHRQGQIVILADDLEKVDRSVKPSDVVTAIETARRQGLALVAASRPYGVPADFRQGRIDLEPLHDRDVRADLLDVMTQRTTAGASAGRHGRSGRRVSRAAAQLVRPSRRTPSDGRALEQAIAKLVSDAEISLTPYYLSLARVLARHGRLAAPPEGHDARLWLLDHYRAAMEVGQIRADAEVGVQRRRAVLKDLEAIAFVRVGGPRTEGAIATELRRLGLGHIDVSGVVDDARCLGLVETSHDGVVQFAHPTTLAYFASCYLVEHDDDHATFDQLIDGGWGPFRALALTFATTAAHDPALARRVCARLLHASAAEDGAGRGWLTSAIEIARFAGSLEDGIGEAILAQIPSGLGRTREFSQPQAGVLKALGRLCRTYRSPQVYEALWRYATTSGDYVFRRQAIKTLADGREVTESLMPMIERRMLDAATFAESQDEPLLDDRGPLFESLTAVAWILPSLRSVADQHQAQLDAHQATLLGYASTLTRQRGLEAAIAQGLKLDAVRDGSIAPDRFAIEMLSDGEYRAQFWFSRVLLLQCLARRCGHGRSGESRELIRAALRDEHPFVRRTAALCLRALDDERPERFLFEDLTDVASRAPYELDPATSQVIGEIVLALNLNEYGDAASRIAFGETAALPGCLSARGDRSPILRLDTPRPPCPFAEHQAEGCLCPYTRDYPPDTNRRELSRAFCRHQRLHARRLPWNRNVSPSELEQFWANMEKRARY